MLRVLFLSGFLFFCLSVWQTALAAKPKLLIISSYHSEYAWEAGYRLGITEVLQDDYQLEYFQMNTKRLPPSLYSQRAALAWDAYIKHKPKLVFLGDDNAIKYLGSHFERITQTPVVYVGLNRDPRDYNIYPAQHLTGVLERPLLNKSLKLIPRLLKQPKKILVLFDSGNTALSAIKALFQNRTTILLDGILVEAKLIGEWDLWQHTIKQTQNSDYDALLIGLYHTLVDKQGEHVSDEKVIRWTVKNTAIPPFCLWSFSIAADKAIGGWVQDPRMEGRRAAEIALNILRDGVSPSDIEPTPTGYGQLMFSRSQLKKYAITLPSDLAQQAQFID